MTDEERDQRPILVALIALETQSLSEQELALFNIAAQLDRDPRRLPFYDRVASFFTEHDGTRMHEVTKQALARIVRQRLGSSQEGT